MKMLSQTYDLDEFSSEERNDETLQSQDEEMHSRTVMQADEARVFCTGGVVFTL